MAGYRYARWTEGKRHSSQLDRRLQEQQPIEQKTTSIAGSSRDQKMTDVECRP